MAFASKQVETTYTLNLNEQEAKAVMAVCSLGFVHFSDEGEKILKKNEVSQLEGMGSVYSALSGVGVRVQF